MIFAVRTDLKMKKGKIAAQVAHCAFGLSEKLSEHKNETLRENWRSGGSKTVVTKIQSLHEMIKLKNHAEESRVIYVIIRDAGKTQVKENTETVIGFVGESNKLNQFTQHLSLM